jgi:hypothetical protein
VSRVIVYKNLVRGTWSIAQAIGRTGLRRGKVLDHRSAVILADVVFCVEESGRQRVLRRGQREVHAWAVGEIVDAVPAGLMGCEVTYHPCRSGAFETRDGVAVARCSYVDFTASHGAIGYD